MGYASHPKQINNTLHEDYFISHELRIPIKQPGLHGKMVLSFRGLLGKKYVESLTRMARIMKDNILFLNEGWLKSKKSRHESFKKILLLVVQEEAKLQKVFWINESDLLRHAVRFRVCSFRLLADSGTYTNI